MSRSPSDANVRDWIGREQEQTDVITIAPLAGLSATLDRDDPLPRDGDPLPPFWHWLFFLPRAQTSKLAPDGHAPLGGFMPPVGLPRRMWAGSQLTITHAPRVGETVRRISRIADITQKSGSTGELIFVKVEHEIHTPRGLAIRELQDLVYREPSTAVHAPTKAAGIENPAENWGQTPIPRHWNWSLTPISPGSAKATESAPPAAPEPTFSRTITPDPVLLFRYSALTFNSHRIHYDRKHAMDVEGYPGLVVHGPLIATLLLDLLRREHPSREVVEFTFKARRPLFDSTPFSVNGRAESATTFNLWALDPQGQVAVQASATVA